MAKKTVIGIGILLISVIIFSTGCDLIKKDGADNINDFERGPMGLVMEFVPNFPGERYLVSDDTKFTIVVDIKNKGTYPKDQFVIGEGAIYLSGFDTDIITMSKNKIELTDMYLTGASPINPMGSFDTAEFDGKIIFKKLEVDDYNPVFLVTACYYYETRTNPNVCIDPYPFDDRQDKVCSIGSKTLSTQGAPITVTKIEQEATTDRVQFKIFIRNVGDGEVLKPGDSYNLEEDGSTVPVLDRCSPLSGGVLDRKDFDRVEVNEVSIGDADFRGNENSDELECGPFADGTDNIIKLFDGEGFVICTLDLDDLDKDDSDDIQSAYTTPLNIELEYNYRSSISKSVKVSRLTSVN